MKLYSRCLYPTRAATHIERAPQRLPDRPSQGTLCTAHGARGGRHLSHTEKVILPTFVLFMLISFLLLFFFWPALYLFFFFFFGFRLPFFVFTSLHFFSATIQPGNLWFWPFVWTLMGLDLFMWHNSCNGLHWQKWGGRTTRLKAAP